MMRTTLIALFLAASLAGAGDSEAEKQFRDAWWRESSESDLPKALAAYRRAAAADGPAEVRAKALLKVAECLKRLDKAQEAMQVLDRLRKEHPGQKEVLDKADRLVKEWTAIDLRTSYSDWYRRYLFSPEFQQDVVDRVLGLPNDEDAEAYLLSLGEAAIPALREAIKSKNAELVSSAMNLLLLLGDLPSAKLLLDDHEWAIHTNSWRAILDASADSRERVAREIDNPAPMAVLLQAAATSPAALLKALGEDAGARLAVENGEAAKALIEALYATRSPAVHRSLADLGVHPKSPAGVRELAAAGLVRNGWIGGTAEDWLEWARDCDVFDYRMAAYAAIGRTLRPGAEEVIDSVFGDLRDVGKIRRDLQTELSAAFAGGLRRNGLSLQLSWSPDRVLEYIRVCLNADDEDTTTEFIRWLRSDRSRGGNVANALLLEPEKFKFDDPAEAALPWYVYYFDLDDPDQALAQARWTRSMQRAILRNWETWDDVRKSAVLKLCSYGMIGYPAQQRALGKALIELTKGKELSAKLAGQIEALAERSDDC